MVWAQPQAKRCLGMVAIKPTGVSNLEVELVCATKLEGLQRVKKISMIQSSQIMGQTHSYKYRPMSEVISA